MKNEKGNAQNQYIIPASIIAAGLIIAGAVIYMGGGSSRTLAPTDQQEDGPPTPVEVAEAIGLNKTDFEACLGDPSIDDTINTDMQEAIASGGLGTPYTVVVSTDGTRYPVYGAMPFAQVSAIIDDALALDASNLATLEQQANGPVGEIRPLTTGDHIRGDADAPVKIIEFSDLQCPYCKSFHPIMQQVMDQYQGQVVWAYRHLPLESIHSSARPLAEGSECAARLGGNDAFWQYVDYIFNN